MRRPSHAARIALGALAIAACLALAGAACTLVATFDDQASCDGGLCVDAGALDGPSIDAGRDAHPADAASDAKYAPCEGLSSGLYCGTDHLHAYRGPATDLVVCDGGAIARVTPCTGGCISMPDPFPDTCNECGTKPTGRYCGRDFAAFPHGDGGNDDMLIGCQSGNVDTNFPCAHGCKSNGDAASCNP